MRAHATNTQAETVARSAQAGSRRDPLPSAPNTASIALLNLQFQADSSPAVRQLANIQRLADTSSARAAQLVAPSPPVRQLVTMADLDVMFEQHPRLREVFRYYIEYALRNETDDAGRPFRDRAEVIGDATYHEMYETLLVWSQRANFAELKRQGAHLDEPTRQGEPKAPNLDEMKGDAMDAPDRSRKMPQTEHARLAIGAIEGGSVLVRRMNGIEKKAFESDLRDIDRVRPKGLLNKDAFPVERSIAFSIDGGHRFTDSARDSDASSYEFTMLIPLKGGLREYLMKFLWNTNRSGGYGNNPQFKLEHGKYNIIVPESGWSAFAAQISGLEFVSNAKEGASAASASGTTGSSGAASSSTTASATGGKADESSY